MEPTKDDFVKLCSAGDNAEASIIRGYLEDAGITVYVQGENHRSMLGMVGAYIELNILVPSSDFEEASEMMRAFVEAEPDDALGELEGPYRDEFEQDEDEDESALDIAIERRTKGVRMIGFIFPFGGAHFAAGAFVRGLVLAGLCITGIAAVMTGASPVALLTMPLSMLIDYKTVRTVVARKVRREKQRTRQAQLETSDTSA